MSLRLFSRLTIGHRNSRRSRGVRWHNDRLDRFRKAQEDGTFEAALAEIRAGAKRGHWIWFIFPQLAGLGSSPLSQRYGIRDAAEAAHYVRDPLLRARLITIAVAAAEQLRRGVKLVDLMGGSLDALKVLSSMTLFEEMSGRVDAVEHNESLLALRDACRVILEAAALEGYGRCAFTRSRLQEG
jgi:uncharacterized protein (DUF1810 family)